MFKTDIEFCRNTLYIDVEGIINKKNLTNLKKKLYYISSEYSIGKVVLNIQKGKNIDKIALYDFLYEYDEIYGGTITITDN